MPPKDVKQTKFYVETESGEHIPFSGLSEIKLESENTANDKYMEYFKGGEFEIELTEEAKERLAELIKPVLKVLENMDEILKQTFLCNNWRKMHGIPLMRGDFCKSGRIAMRGFHKKEKYMVKMYDKCIKRESRYYEGKRK